MHSVTNNGTIRPARAKDWDIRRINSNKNTESRLDKIEINYKDAFGHTNDCWNLWRHTMQFDIQTEIEIKITLLGIVL